MGIECFKNFVNRGENKKHGLADVQIGNVRLSVGERYVKRWVEIHVHLTVWNDEQFCALFHRADVEDDLIHTDESVDNLHMVTSAIDSRDIANMEHRSVEIPMLINVAKTVESPKVKIPTLVRLKPLDDCLRRWMDPAEAGFHCGLKLDFGLHDGKGVMPTGGLPVGDNKLPDEVVKPSTKVVDDVPDFKTPFRRSDGGAVEYPELLTGIDIDVARDRIELGLSEELNFILKNVQFLTRVFDLGIGTEHKSCNLP